MARRYPPFIECWRDRHGKRRVYFRKGRGPRLSLGPRAEGYATALPSYFIACLAPKFAPR
jgi:hypothetical protein